jgi:CHAT domain-containing protein/tetratricopeptide (TPR) repeat protein
VENPPIQLTVLRQGDAHLVDLAEVGSLIPRSETRVEAAFLAQLADEMRRVGGLARDQQGGRLRELQRLGALVYSHLLTESAQRRLRTAGRCDLHLRLDEQLLGIPWELCHDGSTFVATKFRVGRQVITSRPIREPAGARPAHAPLRVLLVADPTETLPFAAAEADRLCELLDGIDGVEVTLLGGRGVRKIALLAALQEHDVVHFAGHGFYDAADPGRSGWRLDDSVLTADELGRLLPPPALVFSNSCHGATTAGWPTTGRYDGDTHGIGSACLLAGVKSFIGTLWEVHDEESVHFAVACYRALAGGAALGEALLRARETSLAEGATSAATWASYVLYGDPTFTPFAGTAAASAAHVLRSARARRENARFDVHVSRDASGEPQVGVVAAGAGPMVGRASVVARLERALEVAQSGRRQIVLVSGPPGIGKTTLVDAFLAGVAARGEALIGQGQAVEQYGAGEAYLPVLEAWSRLCRDDASRTLARELHRRAPSWLAQLPSVAGDATRAPAAPTTTRDRMLREMAELVETVSARRLLVLALEDLHWSDHSTLDLVSYLAERREPARLLVVGTFRPEETMDGSHPLRAIVQRLRGRDRCEELRLEALSEADVAEYLARRFAGKTVPPGLAGLLHARTEGHPLFVVNVLDYLLHEGAVREEDGRLALRDDVRALPATLPDSLRRMIDRQIEALDEDDRRLVEAASVAGVDFCVAAVASALDEDAEQIEERCEALAWRGRMLRGHGVEEWPDGTVSGRYRFLHALYQEALYGRMAEARRVRTHRRVAERKEGAFGARSGEIAGELAAHYEAARDAPRALAHHTRAGDNAIARHASHEAADHLSRALALLSRLPGGTRDHTELELSLLVKLATPLMSVRGYGAKEVEQVFERAHALSRNLPRGPHLFPLLRGMVSFHHVRGQLRAARAIGEELLALCEGSDDRVAVTQAHYGQGALLYDLVELPAARRHLEHALALYEPAAHPEHVSRYGGYDPGVACRCWLAWTSWLEGRLDSAVGLGDEAIALARELGDPLTLTFAHLANALVRLYRSETDEAQAHLDAAEAISRREGFVYQDAIGALVQGWITLLRGRGEEAVRQLASSLERHDATGAGLARPGLLNLLAVAEALCGRFDRAFAHIDDAIAEATRTEQPLHLIELHRMKGELLSWSGVAPKDVERWLQAALDLARALRLPTHELRAAMSLGRLWRASGDVERTRRLLTPVLASFSEGRTTKDLREAQALLG